MEYDYSELDNYDLQLELKSLDEGMKTFTDNSKITYIEAWKRRKRKHKALTEEINKRKYIIMDYKKLNEIASKLEGRHISERAKGIQESKEILAIIQAYRILSLNTEISSDNRSLQYPLQVIRNVDKSKIKVNRYILDNDNVEHIWSNDWYGHHIIGNDCEFNEQ